MPLPNTQREGYATQTAAPFSDGEQLTLKQLRAELELRQQNVTTWREQGELNWWILNQLDGLIDV